MLLGLAHMVGLFSWGFNGSYGWMTAGLVGGQFFMPAFRVRLQSQPLSEHNSLTLNLPSLLSVPFLLDDNEDDG